MSFISNYKLYINYWKFLSLLILIAFNCNIKFFKQLRFKVNKMFELTLSDIR